MLYHLLYLSSSNTTFDDDALQALLAVSRRNNAADGVSGMLLYDDGNFIQYLEGEKAAVETVFERICKDPRHAGMLVVSRGEVDKLCFADWSMGFHGVTPQDRAAIGGFELSREALTDRLGDDVPRMLVAMMSNFYDSTHRFALT